LYALDTDIVEGGATVDQETTRIGIRTISMGIDGFRINGERMFLRGTNRHQEYPYVGYALSDAAQYRDARTIKEAGFDYIRLSHYAHAPAFMDACDQLGLVVMDCIPGWQYFDREDPAFAELQLDNCRALIRRDRNHPCVILWEVSLNESWMTDDFIARSHAIAHEEYPGDQCYTCGWTRGYDVFIQARQHGGCREVTDQACLVSEYGDWEYYAQNAGLEQQAWADLAPDAANSRQLRWHGEAALLQQATNFQEAHNDNRKTLAFADGLWVMFDYNRGYAPDIESSGCMDIFRLPKFSHAFFRSQRDVDEDPSVAGAGPMVFIASYWTPDSSTDVRVFSNCDEVALSLDGALLERRRPDAGRLSTELAHPPFTFRLDAFRPGTLEAVGYVGGRALARRSVRTPGAPRRMELRLDEHGSSFGVDGKDAVFVHADLQDAEGTPVPDAWENVFFGATGDVKLVGANPFSSDAGIASILLQTETARPHGTVCALCLVRDGAYVHVLGAAAPAGSAVEDFRIRATTDGSEPGPGAPVYATPLRAGGRVRAGLFVGGRRVVEADTGTPKFRIAGSTAPEPAP
ncbi:MAG TPA: glycoside hydrolase family 2 TIM barrel-domain containing protein, partial [Longimicrobiales bacterium]|nr:glycoside hydrolase family 2 TIM barrel-domain containing protein [Longimicrobiales bacterium]